LATSTVEHLEVEPLHTSLQFWGCPPHESPITTDEGGSLTVSAPLSLGGARAALTAVGIEAVAAFCLYGVWQLWRLVR
jgi:hypothetical protein